MRVLVLLLTVWLVASGCTMYFKEDHYFQSMSDKSGHATNYFRLTVEGSAAFSTARYIAGYYDERAVDIFFNEVKPGGIRKVFEQDVVEPGGAERIKPLSPEDSKGAFVMILSTNAKAVADAIGQFAESQIVADALTNLLNRRDLQEVRKLNAKLTTQIPKARSVQSELEGLFNAVKPENTAAEAEEAYVRVLNAIASALGASERFTSFQDAAPWFRAISATGGSK